MIDKILSIFDQDTQFKDVWQLKLIKFDIDLDQDLKPYQRYLAISHIVEDSKGNPGMRGSFYVTNLRLVWHGINDRDINLSIGTEIFIKFLGLDSINNVYIKPVLSGASQIKQMLIVKTQSPSGSKYEFKFSIFSDKEIQVFQKAVQVFKQAISTRFYRTIDGVLKFNQQTKKIQTLPKEEIINTFIEGKYSQDARIHDVIIIFTNVRLVIIQTNSNKGFSYGIPWIMIQSFEKTEQWDHPAFQLRLRGLFSGRQIFIRVNKNWTKFSAQFTSLGQAYSKNPFLGIDTSQAISKDGKQLLQANNNFTIRQKQSDIQQVFETKINIKRTKNQYSTQSNVGTLDDTFFNEQLGIMMERLPQGVTRKLLWEILG